MISEEPPSVIDVYDRHGAAWAALRNREEAGHVWLDRFCGMLPPSATVLDIGCGSGVPIAAELVRRGYAVTGIDGSTTMVALAKRNLPGIPIERHDMRVMALESRFAGLIAWDSLFHLSPVEQRSMFKRFADHATLGAVLLFTSGTDEGTAIGTLEEARLYHGSLWAGEYLTLLNETGFSVVGHIREDPSCGHRTVWLAKMHG